MSEKESQEVRVKEVFQTLPNPAQKLLIAMVHPAETGATKDAIIAFSGLEEAELNRAITELKQHNFWEQGRVERGKFVIGEGERFRLPNNIKRQVLRDILKLPLEIE